MNMRKLWWRSSIAVLIGVLALLAATPQAFAGTSQPSVVPITGTVGANVWAVECGVVASCLRGDII